MDWFERVLVGFLAAMIVTFVGALGFAIADGLSTSQGVVVSKHYDDPDLICSKGCFYTSECWTIVVDSEPWWNSETCVSESEYNSIDIGDNFKE